MSATNKTTQKAAQAAYKRAEGVIKARRDWLEAKAAREARPGQDEALAEQLLKQEYEALLPLKVVK